MDITDKQHLLRAYLEQLQCASLVIQDKQSELIYAPDQTLSKEVVYQHLSAIQQREFHRWAGKYMELAGAARLEDYYDTIAYHYEQGEVWNKAVVYLTRAGEQCQTQYANRAAIDYYTRALNILGRIETDLGGEEEYQQQHCWRGLGDAYYLLGEYEKAKHAFQQLLSLVQQSTTYNAGRGYIADVQCRLGRVYGRQGAYSESLCWLEEAEDTLGTPQSAAEREVAARIHVARGSMLHRQGEYKQAIRECEFALLLVGGTEYLEVMAQAYNNMALVYDDWEESDLAQRYYQQSLELRRQIGDIYQIGRVCNNLGTFHFRRGHLAESAEMYEEALRLGEQLGDQSGIAFGCINLGQTRAFQGRYKLAIHYYHRALEILERVGEWHFAALARNNLGFVYIKQQAWQQAQECLEQSLRQFVDLGAREHLAENYRNLAAVQVGLGNAAQALEYARRAISAAQEVEDPFEEGVARRVRGEAYQVCQDTQLAERSFLDSLAILEKLHRKYELGQVLWQLTRVYLQRGQLETATRYGKQAKDIFTAMGAQADLARLEMDLPSLVTTTVPWIERVALGDFEDYVKEALSNLHQLANLTESPLLKLRVLDAHLEGDGAQHAVSVPMKRAEALQTLLLELVEELKDAPDKACWYEVLYRSRVKKKETNIKLMRQLNISGPTFYRYLNRGQQAVAARLRELELMTLNHTDE